LREPREAREVASEEVASEDTTHDEENTPSEDDLNSRDDEEPDHYDRMLQNLVRLQMETTEADGTEVNQERQDEEGQDQDSQDVDRQELGTLLQDIDLGNIAEDIREDLPSVGYRQRKRLAIMESLADFARQFAEKAQVDDSPPLFRNQPQGLTYLDYAHHLLSMKSTSTMGDKLFEAHAKTIVMLLRMGGADIDQMPATLNRLKALLGVENMWESVRHYCPKFHRLFPDTPMADWREEEECGCTYVEDGVEMTCKEKRFHASRLAHGTALTPRSWIVYLGVARTLRRWMGQMDWWEQRAQKEARDEDNADIWGGTHAKCMDGKVDGILMDETPLRSDDMRDVFLRMATMIEGGFDHYPVWGKGAKRYAHENLVDVFERKVYRCLLR
jgi:hypothetical protein